MSDAPRLSLVVAVAENGVIGKDGALPWRIPADMRWFKRNTIGKTVIMGRKTWDSLPRRPLPERNNVVITRTPIVRSLDDFAVGGGKEQQKSLWFVSSFEAALRPNPGSPQSDEICVIGGAQIYAEALPRADRIYLTEVHASPEGDVLMPVFDRALYEETFREDHAADGATPAFSFVILDKRG